MHRGVRAVALHVREQLPGRQGLLQLSGLLECLQASGKRGEQCGKGRSLCANRNAVLSARHERLTAIALRENGAAGQVEANNRLTTSLSGLSWPPRLFGDPKTRTYPDLCAAANNSEHFWARTPVVAGHYVLLAGAVAWAQSLSPVAAFALTHGGEHD